MSRAVLHCGDVRQVLASLPAESVQCVTTSPPYWGLRDYGTAGQLGLERTPEEYVANMVAVFREVRRVLRSDGVCWLNLGDSYNAGRDGGHPGGKAQWKPEQQKYQGRYGANVPGLKPKDLVGIPWRVAFALQADGWWLRSDVIWAKPNPMPESVTDRPTRSHEYLFLLTKSATYYYDATAIAEPSTGQDAGNGFVRPERISRDGRGDPTPWTANPDGTRNARSVWTIATQPYAAAHFATFPAELASRCILAGSTNRACERCGAPWERVTEAKTEPPSYRPTNKPIRHLAASEAGQGTNGTGESTLGMTRQAETVGWQPTCTCENRGTATSVVLDPFGGSGTVAATATGLGRASIYVDLNPAYRELARQRIGPMLCEDAA